MRPSRVAQVLGRAFELLCASEGVVSGNGNTCAPSTFFRVINVIRCLSYVVQAPCPRSGERYHGQATILTRCLDGKYSTLLLQIRYNEQEICYKCATIAGEIEWPTWKMGASCGTLPTEVLRVSEDGQMAIQRGWPRTPQQGGRRCSWPPHCGQRVGFTAASASRPAT